MTNATDFSGAGAGAGAGVGADAAPLRAMAERLDPRDAAAFNNLGVLYASRGMYAEALDVLLHAVTLDPRLRIAMRNLEIVSACPGAIARRLEELTARLDYHPRDRGARLERARLDRVTGHVADAIHMLDGLLAENPEDGDALFERGLIEQRNGDLRRAEQWFTRAVDSDCRADARVYLAEVLYQRGQNEQALAELDRHLAHAFDHAEAHRVRAFILGDMGRLEEAQAASRLAMALNPVLDTIEANLALDVTGVPTPVTASAVQPADTLTHYNLGLAFRQRGYLVEARREFDLAQQQGEDPLRVLHALAELDLVDGHAEMAQSRLELLLVEQDQPRWWTEHGVALHLAGNVTAAIESYRRALRLDPRGALAWNNLGVALADAGDRSAARDAVKRAIELDVTLTVASANAERLEEQGDGPLELHIELQRECPAAVGDRVLRPYAVAPVAPVDERVEAAVVHLELLDVPEAPRGADREQQDAPVTLEHADTLLRTGRRTEAAEAFRELRECCAGDEAGPQSALWSEAARGEVRALCLLDRAGDALPLVRQLGAAAPDDPEWVAYTAAGIVAERGFPGMQAARMVLRPLVLQDGVSAALLHYAGDVAKRIHDEPLALGFYRRALALDPARPSARVAIARMLRRRGDLMAARLELVAALAVAPHRADAVVELARVHVDAARLADARAVLAGFLARVPDSLEALTLLADVLMMEARHGEARRVVDRLIALDPQNAAAIWFDGVLLVQEGRAGDAVARWALVAMNPEAEPWAQRARREMTRALDAADPSTAAVTLRGVA